MSWFSAALLAATLFGLIRVVDKVVIDRYIGNLWTFPVLAVAFLSAYSAVLVALRAGLGIMDVPDLETLLIALAPGLLHFCSALLFTKAFLLADASTVAGVNQVTPTFAVLFGFLAFGERFHLVNYLGIGLLVLCAVLLGRQEADGATRDFNINRAVGYIVVAAMFRGLADMFLKMALAKLAYWDAFSLSRVGAALPIVAVIATPSVRKSVVAPIRRLGWRLVGVVGIVEMAALANLMVLAVAYDRGPLALVAATQATVPMFVLTYGGLINWWRPGFVPVRDVAWRPRTKYALFAGLIVGVYLIHLGR